MTEVHDQGMERGAEIHGHGFEKVPEQWLAYQSPFRTIGSTGTAQHLYQQRKGSGRRSSQPTSVHLCGEGPEG